MGFSEVLIARIGGGTLIPLFAIYMHSKSEGVPLFGSGRRARKRELESRGRRSAR